MAIKKRSAFTIATVAIIASLGTSDAMASAGCGGASWYALGSRTASGERMNASLMTAAHKSLKFGTRLRVTNKRNGRTVVVRVNDRGPFIRGRVLDLSKAAAQQVGMISSGTAQVCYEVMG